MARFVIKVTKKKNSNTFNEFSLNSVCRCDVVNLLLTDSRGDPAAGNNLAIQGSSGNSHHDVVSLLLSDHRMDS